MDFKLFKVKSTGVVALYPAHYDKHPIFKDDLEPYDPEQSEVEVDKVVIDDNHELPVEQRTRVVVSDKDDNKTNDKE